MQTKSEMINRIAELAEEVEQWKHEYEILNACCELAQGKIAELKAYKDVNEDFKTAWEELKAENDRLKEEINDFISDISTCGFKYDDRCPDNLDELQCCIEDLCNKFSNYKQTLQEIKAIVCGNYEIILKLITKAEEE